MLLSLVIERALLGELSVLTHNSARKENFHYPMNCEIHIHVFFCWKWPALVVTMRYVCSCQISLISEKTTSSLYHWRVLYQPSICGYIFMDANSKPSSNVMAHANESNALEGVPNAKITFALVINEWTRRALRGFLFSELVPVSYFYFKIKDVKHSLYIGSSPFTNI